MDRARLVYGLVTKIDMDVGSFISRQISQMALSNSSRLGFPALITTLCIAREVVPDSLTFESLSPAINLAYIRKNWWNPDDPTITFPDPQGLGSRTYGRFHFCSFLLYSHTCSSTTSSSTQSTPWLMSGDAEHSWLGSASTHYKHGGFHGSGGLARSPSFSFGGGEAPIAQEPQPESEATLEATPEETPEDTPAATPSEAPEEGDGAADTDYVVDMAATQSSWDPWPIPAPDTSLPAPDAPSTPQDNPTPAQDGWRHDLFIFMLFRFSF